MTAAPVNAHNMNAIIDSIHAQLAQLRTKLDEQFPALQRLEDQTNVPKEYLATGGTLILLIVIFFGLSPDMVCTIIGFFYPAFRSLKAIEHRATGNGSPPSGDITQWMIYWIVYAFFSIIEIFIDALLYWIPFYYKFKVAFLLWAMLPQTRGAKFLYDSFLKDFLKSKESMIDKALNDAKSATAKVVVDTVTENKKDT